jgi:SPP1 family predicted phage head-tail adaptor
MNAGELNKRVTIENTTVAGDAYGAKSSYAAGSTVWASVRPQRATEILRAQQPGMETAYIVKMRYTSEVKSDSRLLWEGRYLYISSVIDVNGRHIELELICHEREAANV